MANPTTLPVNPSVIALDSVVSRIEANEQQRRHDDAVQVRLFAEALDQASADHFLTFKAGRLIPGNDRAEIAYRSIRAEIACALGISEQTVERRMTHAHSLTHNYYDTYLTLSEGQIGVAHTEVIVTAGHVIGEAIDPATIARRGAYEAAVLVHAVRETPARLRPIARRLAEQYAERTLDERHREACQQRRVWVVDREDGMSDLTAHLPSVEAHAIFDRLTRASRVLANVEQREQRAQGEPVEPDASKPQSVSPAAESQPVSIDADKLQSVSLDADKDAAAAGSESASDPRPGPAPESSFVCRSRDELRTDLFSELLRTGLNEALGFGRPRAPDAPDARDTVADTLHGHVRADQLSAASPSSPPESPPGASPGSLWPPPSMSPESPPGTSPGSPPGTSPGTSPRTSPGAPSGLDGVQAHVQVFITDETLFSAHLRIDDDGDSNRDSIRDLDLDGSWGAPTSRTPAELAGSGPIDTGTARKLAASATHWELVRQHPDTGAVISVDRYRPSEQMRRILGARDLHCRFPGCRAPLHRCDIDHTIDAQYGGPTSTSNLAHLCRGHHTLKHHGGWKVSQADGGVLHWESPAGRTYTDRPPSKVRFMTPTEATTHHQLSADSPPELPPF